MCGGPVFVPGKGYGHSCMYCDAPATEAAHIVEASKRNIRRYGFDAIYSRFNLIPTCHEHNSMAMNEARGPVGEAEQMAKVVALMRENGIVR